MAVIGPPLFERLLAGLEGETFAAFVSDVWSARGVDARVEGSDVIVSGAGERAARTIRTVHWRSRLALRFGPLIGNVEADRADVIVTNRDHRRLEELAAEAGIGYVGPDRLREICLYAIDRDRCEALFRSYFDRSVSPQSADDRPDPRSIAFPSRRLTAGLGLGSRPGPGRQAAVIGIVVALTLVAAIGLGAEIARTPAVEGPAEPSISPVGGPGEATYPPSIAAADQGRLSSLIHDHRTAVANTSVRLTITLRNARGTLVTRTRWVRSRQTIVVDPGDRVTLRVEGVLPPATIAGDHRPVEFTVVGNASECMARGDWNATGFPAGGPCTILSNGDGGTITAEITATYVRRYVNGTDPVVRPLDADPDGAYRIESTRPPRWFPVEPENYSAVAIVDARGVITELRVSYESPLVSGTEGTIVSYSIEDASAT